MEGADNRIHRTSRRNLSAAKASSSQDRSFVFLVEATDSYASISAGMPAFVFLARRRRELRRGKKGRGEGR